MRRGSVSIVGLAKNAGKTEVLNYILGRVAEVRQLATGAPRHTAGAAANIAVTSIGLDGERVDQVKRTPKPEIELAEGMVFTTSETHFRQKRLAAEVLDVGGRGGGDTAGEVRETALGRLVTARALTAGKVILSGPSDTDSLRRLIAGMGRFGVKTVLVDGALSRLSHGSPAVTEGMVLVTGAAVSHNIERLVRETKYVFDRTGLPVVETSLGERLAGLEGGVWVIDGAGEVHDAGMRSALTIGAGVDAAVSERAGGKGGTGPGGDIFRLGTTVFVPGVVSERLLEQLRVQKNVADIQLIVRDFTRIFATPETYCSFLARGGRVSVLQRSEVLAVCVNPTSPEGYRLDSARLVARMSEALGVPVYDVRRL